MKMRASDVPNDMSKNVKKKKKKNNYLLRSRVEWSLGFS